MSLQELMSNIDTSIDVNKLDIELFTLALTHSSYAIDNSLGKLANNERLEFYGDSVLKLACSKFLYETFPNEREGLLSSYRSILVSDAFLAKYARWLYFWIWIGFNLCIRQRLKAKLFW